ncbi:MAG TPA: MBL fold metallo-hydrolase [Pseudonocardiaceae bacterium]|nr:MBL fold metallo-hydrolase [Pseudonocardiaceae bacterium]
MTGSASGMAVRLIGGPTVLIEVGGLRLLTDPTLDRTMDEIGPVDAVLLSHDQHGEPLGPGGRSLLERAPLILTNPGCAAQLGGCARGLPPWYHLSLARSDGGVLRITGVPTQQGPDETVQRTGFVLSGMDIPTGYISVTNISLDVVREIARRCGPIDFAVLNGSFARSGKQAFQVAAILDFPTIILAPIEGWEHLRVLAPGETAMFYAQRRWSASQREEAGEHLP